MSDEFSDLCDYLTEVGLFPPVNNVNFKYVRYDDKYVATVELPGFKRAEVEVKVDSAFVVVTGTKPDSDGRFAHARFLLYSDIIVDEISPVLEDGILTITMPRQKARVIEVK